MMHEQVVRFACSLDERRAVLSMIFEIVYSDHKETGFPVHDGNLSLRFFGSICAKQLEVTGINPLMGIYLDYKANENSSPLMSSSSNMEIVHEDGLHSHTNFIENLLLRGSHPGSINISKTGLNIADIKSLFKALCKRKHQCLRKIDLSHNKFTNCLAELLDGTENPQFRTVESIDLSNTGLNTTDVKHLFTTLQDGRFQALRELQFLPVPLTNCLSIILKVADHPAFPFSRHMMLQKSYLIKEDIKNIGKSLHDGKLRYLREIDLSENVLTDCMTDLLGENVHPRFTALQVLKVTNCQLGPADVKCLFDTLQSGKFPEFSKLSFLPATLTDCLEHILPCERRHKAYPFSKVLPLKNTSLTKGDIKSLFNDISLREFSDVKHMDLSGNKLTNGFKEALGSADLVKYPYLEILEIGGTGLSAGDITAICSAMGSEFFPQLKLTSAFLLKHIFEAADPHELPLLENLQLNGIGLVKQDLITIHERVASDQLPHLELLNLSNNLLADSMGSLLGNRDIVAFKSLRLLQLQNTRLRKSDLYRLFQALNEGMFPVLEELDISNNTLSDSLGGLLDSVSQHLVVLDLRDTCLAEKDVKDLCSAVKNKKFLKLEILSLCRNTLTNHVRKLLCATDEVVLPCLWGLWISNTAINDKDVAGLSKSVRSGKLPQLECLHLELNRLERMKTTLIRLVEVCIRSSERKLQLYLDMNKLTPKFMESLKSKCSESTVLIVHTDWEQVVGH